MKASKIEPSAMEAYGSSRAHRSYGRWRAATLIGVYVLMTVHVLHWKITGKTLAPLELNEVMYTLELGIVTAGFLFMALAVLASAIFGRFFCSWGCHILALQDLCAWILGKLRIKPRGIRSRLLAWLPLFAAFYMFAWPQVARGRANLCRRFARPWTPMAGPRSRRKTSGETCPDRPSRSQPFSSAAS